MISDPDKDNQKIIDIVDSKPGIKGTELVVDFLHSFYERVDDGMIKTELPNSVEILNNLVAKGEIVEVEYVLPSMAYRVKSLYFPKRTEFRVLPNSSSASISEEAFENMSYDQLKARCNGYMDGLSGHGSQVYACSVELEPMYVAGFSDGETARATALNRVVGTPNYIKE